MAERPIAEGVIKFTPDRRSLRDVERVVGKTVGKIEQIASRGGLLSKAYQQPLGKITGAVGEFEKSLEASHARVVAFGASAGIIYQVTNAIQATTRAAIELEHRLAEINIILGASREQLKGFSAELFNIAKNTGQTFNSVSEAALEFARQGLAIEETLIRTRDAMVLTRLAGLDVQSSVESVTATINSFNQTVITSTQLVNKLANVDAAFAVSSADLANAIRRVGSSAQDAGVGIDELIAMVTTAQQVTARGGSVIGNSLKTIFTRLQRPQVIQDLQAFGVATKDMQGNALPAIKVLQNFADTYSSLTPAQRAVSAEMVGGVFQVNVLKAAIGDLGKEFSIYDRALGTSIGSTDQAIQRNAELNKTLKTLINESLVNLEKVGAAFANITISPAIRNVLEAVNSGIEALEDKAQGDSMGIRMGKGILEGIGSILKGPGMILLGGLLAKLTYNFFQFSTDAVKTFAGLNQESRTQAEMQQLIQNILLKNPDLIQAATHSAEGLKMVENEILTLVKSRNIALEHSVVLANKMAQGLSSGDLRALNKAMEAHSGGGATAGAWRPVEASRGLLPSINKRSEATEAIGAISGGYMPGKIKQMNVAGLGKVTYNDAEHVKHFPGMDQPAIMPPSRSEAGRTYKEKFKNKHGFDPYAYGGYVPNFLNRKVSKEEIERNIKLILDNASGAESLNDLVGKVKRASGNTLSTKDAHNIVHRYTGRPGSTTSKAVRQHPQFNTLKAIGEDLSEKGKAKRANFRENLERGNTFEKRLSELGRVPYLKGKDSLDFSKSQGRALSFERGIRSQIGIGKSTKYGDAHSGAGHGPRLMRDKVIREIADLHDASSLSAKVESQLRSGNTINLNELAGVNFYDIVAGTNSDGKTSTATPLEQLKKTVKSKGAKDALAQIKGKKGTLVEFDYLIDAINLSNLKNKNAASGLIPNLATKILDRDYLEQQIALGGVPMKKTTLKSGKVKETPQNSRELYGSIVEEAAARGVIKEVITGVPGIGKTTYAIEQAGGPNFIKSISELGPGDTLIALRAATEKVDTPEFQSAKKVTHITGDKDVVMKMREDRKAKAKAGKSDTILGRNPDAAYFAETSGLTTEALLAEKYRNKFNLLERHSDMSLKAASREAAAITELDNATVTMGNFGPYTKGHLEASQQRTNTGELVVMASKGVDREYDLGLTASEKIKLIELSNPSAKAIYSSGGMKQVFEHKGQVYRLGENKEAVFGSDRVFGTAEETAAMESEIQAFKTQHGERAKKSDSPEVAAQRERYKGMFTDDKARGARTQGFKVTEAKRNASNISATKVRKAIVEGNVAQIKEFMPESVVPVLVKNLPTLQERARLIQQRKDNSARKEAEAEAALKTFTDQHGARKKANEPLSITSERNKLKEAVAFHKKRQKGAGGSAVWERLGLQMQFFNGLIPNFAFKGLHEKDLGNTFIPANPKQKAQTNLSQKAIQQKIAQQILIRGPQDETLIVGTDLEGRTNRMTIGGMNARKISKGNPKYRLLLQQIPDLFNNVAYELGQVIGAKFDPAGATDAVAGRMFEDEFAAAHGLPAAGAKKGSDFIVAEEIARKLGTHRAMQLKLSTFERSKRRGNKIVNIASSFSKYLIDILTNNIRSRGLSSVTTPDNFQKAISVFRANPALKEDWLSYMGPMGLKARGHIPNFVLGLGAGKKLDVRGKARLGDLGTEKRQRNIDKGKVLSNEAIAYLAETFQAAPHILASIKSGGVLEGASGEFQAMNTPSSRFGSGINLNPRSFEILNNLHNPAKRMTYPKKEVLDAVSTFAHESMHSLQAKIAGGMHGDEGLMEGPLWAGKHGNVKPEEALHLLPPKERQKAVEYARSKIHSEKARDMGVYQEDYQQDYEKTAYYAGAAARHRAKELYGYSAGLIPGLADAVKREEDAGYSSGQVKVGFDSRLKESGGVGVYNTTEGSLSRAVNMHLADGKNISDIQEQGAVSRGHIPNFASLDASEMQRRMGVDPDSKEFKEWQAARRKRLLEEERAELMAGRGKASWEINMRARGQDKDRSLEAEINPERVAAAQNQVLRAMGVPEFLATYGTGKVKIPPPGAVSFNTQDEGQRQRMKKAHGIKDDSRPTFNAAYNEEDARRNVAIKKHAIKRGMSGMEFFQEFGGMQSRKKDNSPELLREQRKVTQQEIKDEIHSSASQLAIQYGQWGNVFPRNSRESMYYSQLEGLFKRKYGKDVGQVLITSTKAFVDRAGLRHKDIHGDVFQNRAHGTNISHELIAASNPTLEELESADFRAASNRKTSGVDHVEMQWMPSRKEGDFVGLAEGKEAILAHTLALEEMVIEQLGKNAFMLSTSPKKMEEYSRLTAREALNRQHLKQLGAYSRGLVPSFANDALKEAIGREKAAGYSSGQVKVGFDRRLKESGGIGVYNTTEGSLTRAINMHAAQGKTMSDLQKQGASRGMVPNFFDAMDGGMMALGIGMLVPQIKELREGFADLTTGPINEFDEALAQATKAVQDAKDAEEDKAKALKESKDEEKTKISDRKELGEKIGKEEKESKRLQQEADVAQIEVDRRNLGGGLGESGDIELSEIRRRGEAAGQERVRERLGLGEDDLLHGDKAKAEADKLGINIGEEVSGETRKATEEIYKKEKEAAEKALKAAEEKAKSLREQANHHKNQANTAKEQWKKANESVENQKKKIAKQEEELRQSKRQTKKTSISKDKIADKHSKAAEGMDTMWSDEETRKKGGLALLSGKGGRLDKFLKGKGAGLAFAAPMMASQASNMLGLKGKGKAAVESAGEGVGTAVAMGTMLGPIGLIGGAAIGVKKLGEALAKAEISAKAKTTEESLKKISEGLTAVTAGGQSYLESLDKWNNALADTTGKVKPEDLKRIRNQMAKSLGQIPSEFQARFRAAAGDAEKIKQIFGEITEELTATKNDLESAALGYKVQADSAAGGWGWMEKLGLSDTTLFEKDELGRFKSGAEGQGQVNTMRQQMSKAMNREEMVKALEGGLNIEDIDFRQGDISDAQKMLGESTKAYIAGLKDAEDVEVFEEEFKKMLKTQKEGIATEKEITAETKKRKAAQDSFLRSMKTLNTEISSLNATLGKVTERVQARIAAIDKISNNVKEFQVDFAKTRLKGAQKLGKPFQTKQQEIQQDLDTKILEINAKFVKDMRKVFQEQGAKNLSAVVRQFTEASDKVAKQSSQLSGKQNRELLTALERNRTAQEALAPVVEEALLVAATGDPEDANKLEPLVEKVGTILEANGIDGSRSDANRNLLLATIKNSESEASNKLSEIIQKQQQQIAIEQEQASWARKSAELEERLASFGGAKDLMNAGKTGGGSTIDDLGDVLNDSIKSAVSINITDMGRASMKLLDTFVNKMNMSSLQSKEGLKAMAPLLAPAIAGRTRDIQNAADMGKRLARIADPSGKLESSLPQVDAEKIATEQIASQLKLNQLPDDVAAIKSHTALTNLLISKQAEDIAQKNKAAFSDAMRLNGLPQNMQVAAMSGRLTANNVDALGGVNATGFGNLISGSKNLQALQKHMPAEFATKNGIITTHVTEALGKSLIDQLSGFKSEVIVKDFSKAQDELKEKVKQQESLTKANNALTRRQEAQSAMKDAEEGARKWEDARKNKAVNMENFEGMTKAGIAVADSSIQTIVGLAKLIPPIAAIEATGVAGDPEKDLSQVMWSDKLLSKRANIDPNMVIPHVNLITAWGNDAPEKGATVGNLLRHAQEMAMEGGFDGVLNENERAIFQGNINNILAAYRKEVLDDLRDDTNLQSAQDAKKAQTKARSRLNVANAEIDREERKGHIVRGTKIVDGETVETVRARTDVEKRMQENLQDLNSTTGAGGYSGWIKRENKWITLEDAIERSNQLEIESRRRTGGFAEGSDTTELAEERDDLARLLSEHAQKYGLIFERAREISTAPKDASDEDMRTFWRNIDFTTGGFVKRTNKPETSEFRKTGKMPELDQAQRNLIAKKIDESTDAFKETARSLEHKKDEETVASKRKKLEAAAKIPSVSGRGMKEPEMLTKGSETVTDLIQKYFMEAEKVLREGGYEGLSGKIKTLNSSIQTQKTELEKAIKLHSEAVEKAKKANDDEKEKLELEAENKRVEMQKQKNAMKVLRTAKQSFDLVERQANAEKQRQILLKELNLKNVSITAIIRRNVAGSDKLRKLLTEYGDLQNQLASNQVTTAIANALKSTKDTGLTKSVVEKGASEFQEAIFNSIGGTDLKQEIGKSRATTLSRAIRNEQKLFIQENVDKIKEGFAGIKVGSSEFENLKKRGIDVQSATLAQIEEWAVTNQNDLLNILKTAKIDEDIIKSFREGFAVLDEVSAKQIVLNHQMKETSLIYDHMLDLYDNGAATFDDLTSAFGEMKKAARAQGRLIDENKIRSQLRRTAQNTAEDFAQTMHEAFYGLAKTDDIKNAVDNVIKEMIENPESKNTIIKDLLPANKQKLQKPKARGSDRKENAAPVTTSWLGDQLKTLNTSLVNINTSLQGSPPVGKTSHKAADALDKLVRAENKKSQGFHGPPGASGASGATGKQPQIDLKLAFKKLKEFQDKMGTKGSGQTQAQIQQFPNLAQEFMDEMYNQDAQGTGIINELMRLDSLTLDRLQTAASFSDKAKRSLSGGPEGDSTKLLRKLVKLEEEKKEPFSADHKKVRPPDPPWQPPPPPPLTEPAEITPPVGKPLDLPPSAVTPSRFWAGAPNLPTSLVSPPVTADASDLPPINPPLLPPWQPMGGLGNLNLEDGSLQRDRETLEEGFTAALSLAGQAINKFNSSVTDATVAMSKLGAATKARFKQGLDGAAEQARKNRLAEGQSAMAKQKTDAEQSRILNDVRVRLSTTKGGTLSRRVEDIIRMRKAGAMGMTGEEAFQTQLKRFNDQLQDPGRTDDEIAAIKARREKLREDREQNIASLRGEAVQNLAKKHGLTGWKAGSDEVTALLGEGAVKKEQNRIFKEQKVGGAKEEANRAIELMKEMDRLDPDMLLTISVEQINAQLAKLKESFNAIGQAIPKEEALKLIEARSKRYSKTLQLSTQELKDGTGTAEAVSSAIAEVTKDFITRFRHLTPDEQTQKLSQAEKDVREANIELTAQYNGEFEGTLALFKKGIGTTEQLNSTLDKWVKQSIEANEYGFDQFAASLRSGFTYTIKEFDKDMDDFARGFGKDFKSGVSGAFSQAIKGTKDLKEAFAEMFGNIADKMLDKSLDMAVNAAFKGFGLDKMNKGGLVKGYSSGGMVFGGSGVKDDVPAYLSRGEYVIKRSSVNKYGKDFFDSLNQSSIVHAASGGPINDQLAKLKEAETSARRKRSDVSKAGLQAYSYKFEDKESEKKDWLGRKTGKFDMRTETGYRLDLSKPITAERIDAIKAVASKYPDIAKHIDKDILDKSTLELGKGKHKIHLKNKFIYDDLKRPKAGKFMTDSNLSALALTDEDNPQNRYKFEKADNFWNYQKERLEYLANQKEQEEKFHQSKKNRRTSFLFGAGALLFAGSMMGKFARGGRTEDDIPALLTGGEYVVRKGIVDKYGLQFFENLNRGRINTYNKGGYVSPASITDRTGADVGDVVDSTSREYTGALETTNNISIVVNVDGNGGISTEANQGTTTDVNSEEGRVLGDRIKSAVLDVIVKEKRPGGLLYE